MTYDFVPATNPKNVKNENYDKLSNLRQNINRKLKNQKTYAKTCLLYTSPSPRDS